MKIIWTFILLISVMASALAAGHQLLNNSPIPKEALLHPIGRLDPDKRLHLAVELPIRNKVQHDRLLHDLYDPKSPDYGHYLTPQEYAQQFGTPQVDYDAVVAYFKNLGFIVTISPNRLLLDIDGPVKLIEATFHTTLWLFKHPTEDRDFYAPKENPSVDLDIPLSGIFGLDNFTTFHPVWGDHPKKETQ